MKELISKIKGRGLYIAIACVVSAVLIVLIICVFHPKSSKKSFSADALITTSADASGNTVTHLYKQYSEIFTADTDIPTDTPESAAVRYADYADYNEDLLFSLFMDGLDYERVVSDDEGADIPTVFYYDWENKDSKLLHSYLRISPDSNEFVYSNESVGDFYKYPTENFHTYQSLHSDNNELPLYETVYKAEELDFISREQAVAIVQRNLLDSLGYTLSDNVEIYAIDHKTMQSYQDEALATAAEQGTQPYEHYRIKDEFTEYDDFYILCFTAEEDGIKLSDRDYFSSEDGRRVRGAHIRVHLNRDGIFYCECAGIMQTASREDKAEKLLTVEEAIDKASEMYSELITTDSEILAEINLTKVVLTEVEFEYACVPNNQDDNEIMLVPSWKMLLEYTSGDGYSWTETLAINAITGEAIS